MHTTTKIFAGKRWPSLVTRTPASSHAVERDYDEYYINTKLHTGVLWCLQERDDGECHHQ